MVKELYELGVKRAWSIVANDCKIKCCCYDQLVTCILCLLVDWEGSPLRGCIGISGLIIARLFWLLFD